LLDRAPGVKIALYLGKMPYIKKTETFFFDIFSHEKILALDNLTEIKKQMLHPKPHDSDTDFLFSMLDPDPDECGSAALFLIIYRR
jgi:hypothetical protein